ncbi:putative orphan protein [Pseudoalteromonas luteoviolacea B = ATCC 29581]|nr:putative orphan protein [Pseudoalteromonas luteoviolacea B = ATCC 29581]
MKKLLTSPSKMALPEIESGIYQNILKQATEISLNLMAVKVTTHPEDFLGWCYEMLDVVKRRINFDLLDDHQLPTVKKLQDLLSGAISFLQLKSLRVAPWPVLITFIEQNKHNLALDEQLRFLDHINGIREQKLADMIGEDRAVYAGKYSAALDTSAYPFDCEWFASTKAAKGFHQALADLPYLFDEALQHIPLCGEVNEAHYQAFVIAFVNAFNDSDEQATLAPATRLLAMRRPDVFTPIMASKQESLCLALGIARLSNRDFERYWQDVVMTVSTLPWFKHSMPANEFETKLTHYKALLPCWFYYADEDTPTQSNYYKAINKPTRTASAKSASGNRAVRRGKESATILVDRALENPDLPAYLKEKRGSIIAEVEKGRSVDETIQLLRAIFG